jgi:hypothetical protein
MSYNPEQPGRRCAHLYPVRVVVTEELRRARCLGCGMVGPASGSLAGAMRALRVSVSGIQPAIPRVPTARIEQPRLPGAARHRPLPAPSLELLSVGGEGLTE